MKYLGYTEIRDNKVIFVYYELEKPNPFNGFYEVKPLKNSAKLGRFDEAMKEYEASKRSIKVSNELWSENNKDISGITVQGKVEQIKHNQLCEARVGKEIATIIRML